MLVPNLIKLLSTKTLEVTIGFTAADALSILRGISKGSLIRRETPHFISRTNRHNYIIAKDKT